MTAAAQRPPTDRPPLWAVALGAVGVAAFGFWLVGWFWTGHLPGDAFTYLAAGQRLNAGHEIYRLMPGDSPVLMSPPYPPYPLLSPPLIAVVFRPLAALPGDAGAWLWWAVAAVVVIAVVLACVAGRPAVGGVAVLVLSFSLGVLAGVGNVDAFVLAGVFTVWTLAGAPTPTTDRRLVVAGVIVGILISIKILPLALAWWLIAMRRWRALFAAAIAIVVAAAVVMVGAYPGAFTDYVEVVRSASGAVPGAASIAGIARLVGLPAGLSSLVQWTFIGLGLLGILALVRLRHPAAAFSLACITMALGSPAAAAHTPALLIGALAPYAVDSLRASIARRGSGMLATSPPVVGPVR